ncbi:sigma-70 family RNA polymerase sigma factor [Ideonella sp. YS5]|uniref:sigma-70 family RNA polymerase sigma factor n=1 Tax=Ideonella sp. YS5 TaxID=3453714 RepID=UPI003EF01218
MQPQESIAAAATEAEDAAAQDERALWIAWRVSRDEAARQTLLSMHLPYARVIAAMTFAQRTTDEIDFDDYLQLARIGMLEAFDRYDPLAGAQFRTYASRRMRGAVLDGIARLSERQQQLNLRRQLLAERSASLAAATDEAAEASVGGATPPVEGDLFQYLAQIGIGLAIGFMLEDTGMFSAGEQAQPVADPAYRAVELRHTRRRLHELIAQLPPAEGRVVRLHYAHGHAFEDIARELAVTKGRVSQIHKKALASLRALMSHHGECNAAF